MFYFLRHSIILHLLIVFFVSPITAQNRTRQTSPQTSVHERSFTMTSNGRVQLRDYRMDEAEAERQWEAYREYYVYSGRGFSRQILPSLSAKEFVELGTGYSDEAVNGVSLTMPNFTTTIQTFNQISTIERAAIQLYTAEPQDDNRARLSTEINTVLWQEGTVEPYEWLILPLVSGLNKMPKYSGISYSGVSIPRGVSVQRFLQQYSSAQPYINRGFISTSLELVNNYVNGSPVLLKIKGKSGNLISIISNFFEEQEVLYSPGCRFKVVSIQRVNFSARPAPVEGLRGQKYVIELEEID